MQFRALVLPAIALGMVVAGCGTDDQPANGAANQQHANHGNDSADSKDRAAAGATAPDVEFAQMMIPHHEQAIEMAEMVGDKKVSDDLLELAGDIESAQQPEIDQLAAMLESWGEDVPVPGGAPESGGGHGGHGGHGGGTGDQGGDGEMAGVMSEKQMKALQRADGSEFERMWLTMMVEHHEGAVTMSEELLADGEDAEARKLAQRIIDAQDAEIDQMNRMLDQSGS